MGEFREAISKTLNSDAIDDAELRGTLDAQDGRLATVKGAFAEALTRVHSVLEPDQREELSDIINEGWGRHRHGRRACA